MKDFEISYTSTITIQANSLEEAAYQMNEMYPGRRVRPERFYDCYESMDYEVIGMCESSGLAIFEHDDYSKDEDGIMWLNI